MRTKKLVVHNEHGMHGRVALRVAERSRQLDALVIVKNESATADGRSVLELLMLGAQKGSELELTVEGRDEERGLAEIAEIFDHGSGI
jgi:phosphocarrier protein HPr